MKRGIPKTFRGAVSEGITITEDFLAEIEKRFAKSAKSETSMLLQSLVSMKYKGKGNVREYIMEMSNTASKLKKEKWSLNELILNCVQEEEMLKQERIESARLASTSKDKGKKEGK
eukprot:XP_015579327.1 uncharacterized protein LOC107261842 [Ricinus communis]